MAPVQNEEEQERLNIKSRSFAAAFEGDEEQERSITIFREFCRSTADLFPYCFITITLEIHSCSMYM